MLALLSSFIAAAAAINDGLAKTPPMGWNSVRLGRG
jgi:hypothetical protein